jgi:hypothetical protein
MSLNKVDHSALTQSHLVDSYRPSRQQKNDTFAGPKELGTQAPPAPTTDQADISRDAHRLVELKNAVDAGRTALEGDQPSHADRLAQVKERLASGFYESAAVRDRVADKISTLFFDGGLY